MTRSTIHFLTRKKGDDAVVVVSIPSGAGAVVEVLLGHLRRRLRPLRLCPRPPLEAQEIPPLPAWACLFLRPLRLSLPTSFVPPHHCPRYHFFFCVCVCLSERIISIFYIGSWVLLYQLVFLVLGFLGSWVDLFCK